MMRAFMRLGNNGSRQIFVNNFSALSRGPLSAAKAGNTRSYATVRKQQLGKPAIYFRFFTLACTIFWALNVSKLGTSRSRDVGNGSMKAFSEEKLVLGQKGE